MALVIDSEVFPRFPGMHIVAAVALGVDNQRANPAIHEFWHQAWDAAAAAREYGNAQSHPRVRPWRERFRAIGVSGKEYPSSVEALLRRAMKGGEPFSINPVVDFYNAISLRHVVPAGGFDLDAMAGPLELRLTRSGDTFWALDAPASEALPAGEVAYCDGSEVLTRHFVWRQARSALLTPTTCNVILLSEVIGEVGDDVAQQVLDDFQEGLREHFGVQSEGAILTKENAEFEWELDRQM